MKLVIDIPEDRYDEIVSGIFNVDGYFKTNLTLAFRNATSLTDCTDAISRSAVMELVTADWKYEGLEKDILSLPSVNPTRPKAKWIKTYKDELTEEQYHKCSNCDHEVGEYLPRFCEVCGAEMESMKYLK